MIRESKSSQTKATLYTSVTKLHVPTRIPRLSLEKDKIPNRTAQIGRKDRHYRGVECSSAREKVMSGKREDSRERRRKKYNGCEETTNNSMRIHNKPYNSQISKSTRRKHTLVDSNQTHIIGTVGSAEVIYEWDRRNQMALIHQRTPTFVMPTEEELNDEYLSYSVSRMHLRPEFLNDVRHDDSNANSDEIEGMNGTHNTSPNCDALPPLPPVKNQLYIIPLPQSYERKSAKRVPSRDTSAVEKTVDWLCSNRPSNTSRTTTPSSRVATPRRLPPMKNQPSDNSNYPWSKHHNSKYQELRPSRSQQGQRTQKIVAGDSRQTHFISSAGRLPRSKTHIRGNSPCCSHKGPLPLVSHSSIYGKSF